MVQCLDQQIEFCRSQFYARRMHPVFSSICSSVGLAFEDVIAECELSGGSDHQTWVRNIRSRRARPSTADPIRRGRHAAFWRA
jgi:hypothetical protein